MTKRSIASGIALILALGIAAEGQAQGRQTGTIRGTARDSQQLVLPGVAVTARSDALQGVRTAIAGHHGVYQILGVCPSNRL